MKHCLLSLFFILTGAGGAAADPDWPMHVAPAGCQFEWRNSAGYYELATSNGVSAFPVIAFSREDWDDGSYPFIPFCGADCASKEGAAKLRALFPLKVGRSVKLRSGLKMTVTARARLPVLGDEKGYVVTSRSAGGAESQSIWSNALGWIVYYRDGDFEKTVVRATCGASGLS